MIGEYFKMALTSIRGAKFRSGLTMFGIIVGVSSVVIIVSLGQGVRQQISGQFGDVGDSLIIVRPGQQSESGAFSLDSLLSFANASGNITQTDLESIENTPGVASSAPIGIVSATPTVDDREFNGSVIATSPDLPTFVSNEIEFGNFFGPDDVDKRMAIIGRDVAEELFQETVPIGRSVEIRGDEYTVQGIFELRSSSSFATFDVNNSIFIPYDVAVASEASPQILQVFVEADSPDAVVTTADNIRTALLENHAGEEDFTVLEKDEALEATNEVFYQLTIFTAGVAFISFIVGGIGIMNIMFATVSERTKEIGIRKAVGATNAQILGQFVMEAVVLSMVGGLIGILTALVGIGVIRAVSDLQPVITPMIGLVVFGLSAATGIISGILPAAQAAAKDPIDALRN